MSNKETRTHDRNFETNHLGIMAHALVTIFSLFVLLLTLAGCSDLDGNEITRQGDTRVVYQDLPNAKKVMCVIYYGTYKGGISCDWSNITTTDKDK
jgi:hypothetical protein